MDKLPITIVINTVIVKGCITKFPVLIPSNVYSSILKPGINCCIKKNAPIPSRDVIIKLVIKFSLIVKKLKIAEDKNTVIAKITSVAIKYIELVGIDTPRNKLKTKNAPNIY